MRKKGSQILDAIIIAATVLMEVVVDQGIRKAYDWLTDNRKPPEKNPQK